MERLWESVRLLVFIGLIFVSAAFGFAVGVVEGFRVHVMVGAVPQGAQAAGLLMELEAGENRVARVVLENQVDDALYYFPQVTEQWWYPVLMFAQPGTHRSPDEDEQGRPVPTQYELDVRRAAAYRKDHVAPLSKLPMVVAPLDPRLSEEARQSVIELKAYRALINATTEKYAQ